ncbi:MAG: PhoH family protein [Calditrichaeota bacterium]|nr:PhoH family protein [Calditrichota bacterium]
MAAEQAPQDFIEIVELPIEEGVLRPLLGPNDENLRYLQRHIPSKVTARREKILIRGTQAENLEAVELIMELVGITRKLGQLSRGDIDRVLRVGVSARDMQSDTDTPFAAMFRSGDRSFNPRTAGQNEYWEAIQRSDLTFAFGPAGTGKTFIAVVCAVQMFQQGKFDRIILVRPVVEAGESLGFLPGDVREKVDPYFRPLYDALMKMIPGDRLRKLLDRQIIEIAPLAYMRGRTLDNAFLIMDEAQNTTAGQMKMFLTRMGENSKAVITGDLTQIDLPRRSDSGLLGIQYILDGIAGIEFVKLNKSDVVRHPLVARIVGAYDRFLQDSASASGDAANETGEDLGKLPEHRSKPSSAND